MTRWIIPALVALWLTGCANFFMYDGVRYESKDAALSAARTKTADVIANTTAYPSTLVDKTLVVVLPTRSTMLSFITARASRTEPATVSNPLGMERLEYLVDASRIGYQANVELLRKKNIYRAVEMLEQDGPGTYAASPERDVLSVQLPDPAGGGSTVWYLTNIQNGRQLVASDVSKASMGERGESMVDSIKALALQR